MSWEIPDSQLPPIEALMANGGRLLVTFVLREMPYAEYLLTNHWAAVRLMALRHHGRRCGICLRTHGLEIHHVTYENRGCEKPEDVIPLCAEHHALRHEILRHILHAEHARLFPL